MDIQCYSKKDYNLLYINLKEIVSKLSNPTLIPEAVAPVLSEFKESLSTKKSVRFSMENPSRGGGGGSSGGGDAKSNNDDDTPSSSFAASSHPSPKYPASRSKQAANRNNGNTNNYNANNNNTRSSSTASTVTSTGGFGADEEGDPQQQRATSFTMTDASSLSVKSGDLYQLTDDENMDMLLAPSYRDTNKSKSKGKGKSTDGRSPVAGTRKHTPGAATAKGRLAMEDEEDDDDDEPVHNAATFSDEHEYIQTVSRLSGLVVHSSPSPVVAPASSATVAAGAAAAGLGAFSQSSDAHDSDDGHLIGLSLSASPVPVQDQNATPPQQSSHGRPPAAAALAPLAVPPPALPAPVPAPITAHTSTPTSPYKMKAHEALQIGLILSQQEHTYGTNMYQSLTPEDEPEIERLSRLGYSTEEAILHIFQTRFHIDDSNAGQEVKFLRCFSCFFVLRYTCTIKTSTHAITTSHVQLI